MRQWSSWAVGRPKIRKIKHGDYVSRILSARDCRLMYWSNVSAGLCSYRRSLYRPHLKQPMHPWSIWEKQSSSSMMKQSPPDLILLDLFMPGMDGVEVLRQLRQHEYLGAVIIITGSYGKEQAWALEPQEVIGKPIDLEPVSYTHLTLPTS